MENPNPQNRTMKIILDNKLLIRLIFTGGFGSMEPVLLRHQKPKKHDCQRQRVARSQTKEEHI